MKLLYFTHNLNFEGAPNVICGLAEKLHNRNGITSSVLSMRDGPARQVLNKSGIRTFLVPDAPVTYQKILFWQGDLFDQYCLKLAVQISKFSPDLVIVNVLHSFFLISILHSLHIPSIWLIHESYSSDEYLSMLPEFHHKRVVQAFQEASKVVLGSYGLQSLFGEWLTHGNTHILHPAIPDGFSKSFGDVALREKYRETFNIQEEDILVLNVGAVEKHKNQGLLVDAAKRVHHAGIRYFLVGGNGESDYQRQVEEQICAFGLQERVMIFNQVDDVIPFYLAADIFVFTSLWDTYPLVVPEAMAFGLPIVATSGTGIKEQVLFGINATETANEPAELASHLETLAADPRLRSKMGKKSRGVYESLESHSEMVNQFEQFIHDAV